MESEGGTPDSALELEEEGVGQSRKRILCYPTGMRDSITKWSGPHALRGAHILKPAWDPGRAELMVLFILQM